MNEVFYNEDDYYLSYMYEASELTKLLDKGIGSPYVGATETAICIREPWKCLILLGDHREQYKPIASDLEACKKYWTEHLDQVGFTSDTLDD